MSRDEKLRANQRRLAERRRANEIAKAKARKKKTPETKTESKPKTRTNTSVAFDKKNDFGSLLKTPKKTPTSSTSTSSSSSSSGGTSKPKSGSGGGSSSGGSSSSSSSASNKAVKGGYTISGGQRKAGTRGSTNPRPMPSNPAVGYSKPVRKNFKTQAAFLKALEVYMRRKNRGADAARSTGKGKAKTATDGRQYGG